MSWLPVGSSWFHAVSGPCVLFSPSHNTKHLTDVGKSCFFLIVLHFCLLSLYVIVSYTFSSCYPTLSTSHTVECKVVPVFEHHTMKMHEGMEVKLDVCLMLGLGRSKGFISCFSSFMLL